MHRPVEDGLEDYLGGHAEPSRMKRFHEHVQKCADCRTELSAIESQARMVRSLKPGGEFEPAPGFYARVMGRIEAQSRESSWSLFLEPLVARQLMFASLCLLVLLASAAVSANIGTGHDSIAATPVSVFADEPLPAADGSDPQHDRTVVLTNLTSEYFGGAGLILTSSD
jgi:predicted anti-sigma-YlaC factor YlaD